MVFIPEGKEIHREGALMRCPNGQAASSEEEATVLHKRYISEQFDRLPAVKKESFMSLCCTAPNSFDPSDPSKPTTHGIFQSNSVRLSGRDRLDGAVFPTFCRCNHSCRPNVRHQWRPDLQVLVLIAVSDIRAGEELYVTYNGGEWGDSSDCSTEVRREYLMEHFGFHCMCPLCKEGDNDAGGILADAVRAGLAIEGGGG
ncbi:hypothetical protein TrRE_jg3892 [Triparma retinervis]|uniref:SET domain-containing protein n=1 Tax=Triparma retinervis TaxID=2557542 RepID=A0A9W7A0C2_9STRA|nr:hypothetical protein TrRE_jg3892 [Triparma retinervis]